MSEIIVRSIGEIAVDDGAVIRNEKDNPIHALIIDNYPDPIGEAELYAIKVALEKQVQLNAEVERIRKRGQLLPYEYRRTAAH